MDASPLPHVAVAQFDAPVDAGDPRVADGRRRVGPRPGSARAADDLVRRARTGDLKLVRRGGAYELFDRSQPTPSRWRRGGVKPRGRAATARAALDHPAMSARESPAPRRRLADALAGGARADRGPDAHARLPLGCGGDDAGGHPLRRQGHAHARGGREPAQAARRDRRPADPLARDVACTRRRGCPTSSCCSGHGARPDPRVRRDAVPWNITLRRHRAGHADGRARGARARAPRGRHLLPDLRRRRRRHRPRPGSRTSTARTGGSRR